MKFKLQFDPKYISSLAHQYMTTGNGAEKDAAMAAAGQCIVDGERTRTNLEIIYRWKSARSVGHLSRNDDAAIDRCLLLAVEAHNDRAAITALVHIPALQSGLHGFQVPVASAILTALFPKRFTVIDYKALASLGFRQASPGVDFYLEYLCACRHISDENKTCLRTLDRALWQWWTNQESAKKQACKDH